MISIEKIAQAKSIVLVVNKERFFNGSALFTYILTLHKKVVIYSEEKIPKQFSFLAWSDKVREVLPKNGDLFLEVTSESLYSFFIMNNIKINKKMATSLYAGLLYGVKRINKQALDGTFFAHMSALIVLGAQHQLCHDALLYSEPLNLFRLKAKMFQDMCLRENGTVALFHLSDDLLAATGASLDEVYTVMKESLHIVHVKEAVLVNKEQKIITRIKEKEFGI